MKLTLKQYKMKTILNTIFLTAILFSCKAQSIIVPIGSGDTYENNPNYYIKDVNNEFNKFEGTWLYNENNSEIILKLEKEVQYQIEPEGSYEDLLVGEYKYKQNNLEVVNSLNDFDNPTISGYEHNISGGIFTHVLPEFCVDNSDPSEIKIELFIKHPSNRKIEGIIILRHVIDNGIEKIQACIYDETVFSYGDDDRIAIPDGFYEFIKQD